MVIGRRRFVAGTTASQVHAVRAAGPAESRTDYAMLMGLVFLLLAGPGPLSVDARQRRGGPR